MDTFTVGGTLASGSTLTVTINTRTVTYTCTGSDTTTTAATALAALLGASDYGEFDEIDWTSSGAVVTGTGPADGTPFTATASAGGSGSPTLTRAGVTSPTGPNWWTDANNWSGGAVPGDADDVTVGGGVAIRHGLGQSAVQLASLTFAPGFPASETVGLPDRNDNGYHEYRKTYLEIGADVLVVDTGSSRIRIDLGSAAAAVTVHDTGRAAAGDFALDLKAGSSSTTVVVNRGQVGLAGPAGSAATVGTVKLSYRDRQDSDAAVELGVGLTVTAVEQTGGDLVMRCGCTTLTREGGTFTRFGSGAVTTWHNSGGSADDYGTGTVGTLNQGARWSRRGSAACTVTNANLYGGGETNDRSGYVTWTTAPVFVDCGPPSPPGNTEDQPPAVHWFNFGYGRKITIADA